MQNVFRPADILLPADCDMTRWSVIACDQYTSEPEYWDKLDAFVGDAPSTLRLMLPEAYLGSRDQAAETRRINAAMQSYLDGGIFKEMPQSYIYLERTLRSGSVRRGIIGALDLEAYDYAPDSATPVRATEGTVAERLPPRVAIRAEAPLEMPHIMVFIDDPAGTVFGRIAAMRDALPVVYDFALSADGGRAAGRLVSGENARALGECFSALEKAGAADPARPVYAMGDGNHSLATARLCWQRIAPTLTEAERETHPARFALVEIVAIQDPAIGFEPIHRVLYDTDPAGFADAAAAYFAALGSAQGGRTLRLVSAAGEREIVCPPMPIGRLIGQAEAFCQQYLSEHGGRIDYVHDDESAVRLGSATLCCAMLLPRMRKSELFDSVAQSGPFPKKSFSIGHACDKRYYLECRRIRPDGAASAL